MHSCIGSSCRCAARTCATLYSITTTAPHTHTIHTCTRSHSHWKRGQPCNWISMASPRLSFHCATEARLTVTRWLAKNVITHTWNTTAKEEKKCASPDSDPDRDPDAVKPSSGYLLLPLRIAKSPPKRETFPGLQSTVHDSPQTPEQTWAQAQGTTMMKMTQ